MKTQHDEVDLWECDADEPRSALGVLLACLWLVRWQLALAVGGALWLALVWFIYQSL